MCEERARLGEALSAGLISRDAAATPLMARTLVTVIAKAVEASDPDAVIQWAQAVRVSEEDHAVVDLVDAVCDAAVGFSERLPGVDTSALIVFLEILRERTRDALLSGKLPKADGAGAVIEGILAMLRAHDEGTCVHSQATGYWCRRLAVGLGLSAAMTERIVRAGTLHDVGKIATPDHILTKPGPLNADEWTIMQQHAADGGYILAEIPALAAYAPIVRSHHERFDGSGYPEGLRADEIPLEARVVAVADAFHAMVTDRTYRAALSYGEAMSVLGRGRGTQWDADVVDVMVRIAAAERTQSVESALALHDLHL